MLSACSSSSLIYAQAWTSYWDRGRKQKNRFRGLGPSPTSSIFQGKQLPGELLQTPGDEEANVSSESVNRTMFFLSLPLRVSSSSLTVAPKKPRGDPACLPGHRDFCMPTPSAIPCLLICSRDGLFKSSLSGTPFHREEALWKISPDILQS